jgi:hypothetical protein
MPTAKKPANRATNIIAGKPRKSTAGIRPVAGIGRTSAADRKTADRGTKADRVDPSTGRERGTERAAAPRRPGIALRERTKGATILGLLQRRDGATLAEMIEATGWQAHSVRGFLSGALRKKHGLVIASTKDAAGERRYRITG